MSDAPDDCPEPPKGALPELTKKLISLGLGAYFLTEEKVVGMVKDARLPRDIGSSITNNASRAKDELVGFVTREIAGVLKHVDIQEEIQRALAKHKIKVTAEIEFLPLEPSDTAEGAPRTRVQRVETKPSEDGTTRLEVETTYVHPQAEAPPAPNPEDPG